MELVKNYLDPELSDVVAQINFYNNTLIYSSLHGFTFPYQNFTDAEKWRLFQNNARLNQRGLIEIWIWIFNHIIGFMWAVVAHLYSNKDSLL